MAQPGGDAAGVGVGRTGRGRSRQRAPIDAGTHTPEQRASSAAATKRP